MFRETASGAKTDRAQLRRLLDQLDAGDVLMVTRLDRLARSTRDLLNTLAAITDKKAGFRSLGDAWADTTTSHGRLMLTVLGGLAEFERDLIRGRTGEGRARAEARGREDGRKPKLTPHQRQEAIAPQGERRGRAGNRPELQRPQQHDFEAGSMTANSTRPTMQEIGADFEHHLEEFRKEIQGGTQFFYAMLAINAVAVENGPALEKLNDAALFWNTQHRRVADGLFCDPWPSVRSKVSLQHRCLGAVGAE